MTGEEFVLSIIAIVMGCTVVIVAVTKIAGLIKSWINRGKSNLDDETFDRLAKAFMQHRKDTDRRLQKLEAILSDEKSKNKSGSSSKSKEIEAPKKSIEIEDHDTEKEKSDKDKDTNLRNMLR
ncbi:MAG TPA: hypothetical protein VJ964_06060 [Balneolaceae bacterium]|nr:hypothetical protein [Balneolaceae bacterium]